MKYLVILHKSKYGYDVHAPALPGCHSQGKTEKEALENIEDAILTYLEMGKEEFRGKHIGMTDGTRKIIIPRHPRINPYTLKVINCFNFPSVSIY